MKKIKIAGLRQILHLSQIEVFSLPMGSYGVAKILTPLAESGINLEFIVANSGANETMDLVLGVQRNHIAAALGLLQGLKGKSGLPEIRSRDPVGLISLFPHGNRAAVIGNFISAFQDAGIKLLATSFTLSALSASIEEALVPEALKALIEYFELPG